jgi:hypothetical protein
MSYFDFIDRAVRDRNEIDYDITRLNLKTTNIAIQVFDNHIYRSDRRIIVMLNQHRFVDCDEYWNYDRLLEKFFLCFSTSIIDIHFIVNSFVIVIILTNRTIRKMRFKKLMIEQKTYFIFEILIIKFLTFHRFFFAFKWHCYFLCFSSTFFELVWYQIQLSQSLIDVAETQFFVQWNQTIISEKSIDILFNACRFMKSKSENIIFRVIERKKQMWTIFTFFIERNRFFMNRKIDFLSRDVTTHNTEDCESRVLMIERSQR